MKTLLLLAMLATGLAPAAATAASDLDTLRARCSDLQRQVRRLEAENTKLKAAAKASQSPADGQTAPEPTAPAKEPVAAVEGKTHKIQAGETFASIAKKYKIPIHSLLAANPTVKPTALRPGQLIHLTATEPAAPTEHAPAAPKSPPVTPPAPPKSSPATPAPPATSKPPVAATPGQPAAAHPTPTAAGSPQEVASAPKLGQKTHAITISKEITYGEFAAQHGTDIKRLNELNGLDLTKATVLAKGSEIYVPGQP